MGFGCQQQAAPFGESAVFVDPDTKDVFVDPDTGDVFVDPDA